MVQPVLDKHCIACHGLTDKPPKGISLIPQPGRDWPSPYMALLPYTKTVGEKGKTSGLDNNISRPYDYYALGGRFLTAFADAHKDKNLSIPKPDFQRIINWLDMNAQCYGTFDYNRKEYYEIDPEKEKALREMIWERFGAELAGQPICALVNGARPQESRILMAPLAAAAGGWGQIKNGWNDTDDPAFQRFEASVNDLFRYPEPPVWGTCGFERCVCDACWARLQYEKLRPPEQPGQDLTKYDRTLLKVVADSEMGEHAALMIDGNERSFWHSRFGENEKRYPHVITLTLADETPIAGLYLKNRMDHENGFIRKYSVSVSTDGETWEVAAEGQLWRTANEQRIVFDTPVRARVVRFTALRSIHGHNYATIAELGVLLKE